MDLPIDISAVKGFLAEDEAAALYQAATEVAQLGPVLEIGSYCGKSTIYLGLACQQSQNTLYALDHHRGSEEHQVGEMFHDEDLFDSTAGQFDSFREFRNNIGRAGLNDVVVPLVTDSETGSRHWGTLLGMVFIDGGHSLEAALCDYRCWSGFIKSGGILAIHDVFPNPAEGGHAPYAVYTLAKKSGLFTDLGITNSLALLRRI
ncbi:MAG: class I SAM-dependent methyltransferase [Pseudomonadales bacterium]